MAEDNLVGQTFSSIAEGYGGAQQTLARFGFVPGSFLPSDKGGAAPQLPTMPPPRFATVASTTLPFPSAVPQFAGASSAPPPSVMPPMFQSAAPSFVPGMAQAFAPPPPPQMATFSPPMFGGFSGGLPIAPPTYTRAFTNPTAGIQQQGGFYSGGTMPSDFMLSGYAPKFMQIDAPGTGVNIMRQRYEASSRLVDRGVGFAGTALNVAGVGTGVIGGAAALGIGGAALAPIAAAAGLVAAPIMAAGMFADSYNEKREQVRQVQQIMSGISSGPLAGPLGTGIDQSVARQIQKGLTRRTGADAFTTEDYISTLGQAQDIGLMRGRTNSVSDIVTRVKELAKLSKTIMDLGEGITQKDALDMQMLAQNMGISTSKFGSQGIASKILASARLSGQTMGQIMSGAGSEGASLFAQMGMNAGAGMMTGITSSALASSMVNSGRLSDRELAMFGGEGGLGSIFTRNIAQFQARNSTGLMLGSLLGPNSFQSMVTGARSISDASGEVNKALGRGSSRYRDVFSQIFEEQAPEMLSSMQENMSPETMQLMMLNQAKALMGSSKRPLTAFSAFRQVTGSEEGARALMKLMQDPSALQSSFKQIDTIDREKRLRAVSEMEDYQGIFSRLDRSLTSAKSGATSGLGINALVDYTSQADADEAARAAGYDVNGRKREFVGRGAARQRIRDRLAGGDTAVSILRSRPGEYSYNPGVSEEDVNVFGNLRNAGFAIDAFESFGFDIEEFGGASRSMTPFLGYSRAESQNRLFSNLRNEVRLASSAFSRYDDYSKDRGSARRFLGSLGDASYTERTSGNYQNKGASAALYKAVNEAVRAALSGGGGTELSRSSIEGRLRASGLNLSESDFTKAMSEVPDLAGALLALEDEKGNSRTSQTIQGLRGAVANIGDINLGTSAADQALGRFNDLMPAAKGYKEIITDTGESFDDLRPGARKTPQMSSLQKIQVDLIRDTKGVRKSLDELQSAAVAMGIEDEADFGLLLETGADVNKLYDILNESTDTAKKSSARKLISKLEGDAPGASLLQKATSNLFTEGKISDQDKNIREKRSAIASILGNKGAVKDLKAIMESDEIAKSMGSLGLININAQDTPTTRGAEATNFLVGLGDAVKSGKVGIGGSAEELVKNLVATAGGDATQLLSTPSLSAGAVSTAEEMRLYMKGGAFAGDADAQKRLAALTEKFKSEVVTSALDNAEGGGLSQGSKATVRSQMATLQEIATMNKDTVASLTKLAGENGSLQNLSASVLKIANHPALAK